MGAYPISLLSVPILGYLAALLTGSWAKGLAFGMLIHVIWVEIWNNGAGFVAPPGVLPPGSPPIGDLLVFYFWATLLMSVVASSMFWMLRWHPLLDGLTVMKVKGDGTPDYAGTGKLVAKVLLVLLIFFGSHIIFELHDDDFPAPWGGVVCTIGVAVGWIVFFLLLRSEYKEEGKKEGIFEHPGSLSVHTTARTFMKNELSKYILFASLGHLIYITAYWVWEFVFNDIATFITSLWYFYASLIIAGSELILMLLIGYFLVRRPMNKQMKSTTTTPGGPTEPLLPPPPPPEVAPEDTGPLLHQIGSYKSPW